MEALESDPQSATASNLAEVARISVRVVSRYSKETLDYIRDFLHKNNNDTAFFLSFQNCASMYVDIDGLYQQALHKLRKNHRKNYEGAREDLKLAYDESDRCEKALLAHEVRNTSSILARNTMVKALIQVAADNIDVANKKVDHSTPLYVRALIAFAVLLGFLILLGGGFLAMMWIASRSNIQAPAPTNNGGFNTFICLSTLA